VLGMGRGQNCPQTPPIWPYQGEMVCESMHISGTVLPEDDAKWS
jgi:hypothetical protein